MEAEFRRLLKVRLAKRYRRIGLNDFDMTLKVVYFFDKALTEG
ncbi:hypothetical protein P3T16_005431 [Paraburkholderia sp. GAS42]